MEGSCRFQGLKLVGYTLLIHTKWSEYRDTASSSSGTRLQLAGWSCPAAGEVLGMP